MDIEKRRRNRDNFLLRLYMLADGSPNKSFIMYDIGNALDLSDDGTDDIARYLSDKEYICILSKDRVFIPAMLTPIPG